MDPEKAWLVLVHRGKTGGRKIVVVGECGSSQVNENVAVAAPVIVSVLQPCMNGAVQFTIAPFLVIDKINHVAGHVAQHGFEVCIDAGFTGAAFCFKTNKSC